MDAKKTIIAAILVLGSATLTAGGRGASEFTEGSFAIPIAVDETENLGVQRPGHAQDSYFQMFGV